MDISYKGIWGYAPLIVTLANTREVLFLVNRSGNATSHADAATWIDKAIDLVAPHAPRVCLRGDTDFSLTEHLDRWAQRVEFIFGMDNNLRSRVRTILDEDFLSRYLVDANDALLASGDAFMRPYARRHTMFVLAQYLGWSRSCAATSDSSISATGTATGTWSNSCPSSAGCCSPSTSIRSSTCRQVSNAPLAN